MFLPSLVAASIRQAGLLSSSHAIGGGGHRSHGRRENIHERRGPGISVPVPQGRTGWKPVASLLGRAPGDAGNRPSRRLTATVQPPSRFLQARKCITRFQSAAGRNWASLLRAGESASGRISRIGKSSIESRCRQIRFRRRTGPGAASSRGPAKCSVLHPDLCHGRSASSLFAILENTNLSQSPAIRDKRRIPCFHLSK